MNTLASALKNWRIIQSRHVAIQCLKRMLKGHTECEQAVLFAENVATEYEQIRSTKKSKLSPNQVMDLVNKYDKNVLSPYAYAVALCTLSKLWSYGHEFNTLFTEYYKMKAENLNVNV